MKVYLDVNSLFDNIDLDEFVADLEDHNQKLVKGTIKVAGGLEAAKDLLKNRPEGCNAYDIMDQYYGYLDDWFMVDHNITINLDDLELAVKDFDNEK